MVVKSKGVHPGVTSRKINYWFGWHCLSLYDRSLSSLPLLTLIEGRCLLCHPRLLPYEGGLAWLVVLVFIYSGLVIPQELSVVLYNEIESPAI